jgi:hypothetical protein
MSDLPPLVAVSLKMYLGVAATRSWVAAIVDVAAQLETGADVELAVLPTFPLLESTAETLSGTGIRWGAQDVAASAFGAQTGEVSAAVLVYLGCRYVEIAHAERRRFFGEDDAVIAAKVAQTLGVGLVPIYCIGEVDRGDPKSAVQVCLRQLERCSTLPREGKSSRHTSWSGRSVRANLPRRTTSRTSVSTFTSGWTPTPARPACCTAAARDRARTRTWGPLWTGSSSGGSPATRGLGRRSWPKSSAAARTAGSHSPQARRCHER